MPTVQFGALVPGLWAIEEAYGTRLFNSLRVDAGDITIQAPEQAEQPSYETQDGIAIIPVCGMLMKGMDFWGALFGDVCDTTYVRRQIANAIADPNVKVILLDIDSPGGEVSGTSDLAADIVAARRVKPVLAFASDMCASGAYWLASQCDAIMCNDTAMIGSIGVYMVVPDTSKRAEDQGVTVHVIRDGQFKGAGTYGTNVTDSQLAEWRRNIKATAGIFRQAVAAGRGMSEDAVKDIADGRCHVGQAAQSCGLVDAVLPSSYATGVISALMLGNSRGSIRQDVVALCGSVHTQDPITQEEDEEMRDRKGWLAKVSAWLHRMPEDFDPDAQETVQDEQVATEETEVADTSSATEVVTATTAPEEPIVATATTSVDATVVTATVDTPAANPELDALRAQIEAMQNVVQMQAEENARLKAQAETQSSQMAKVEAEAFIVQMTREMRITPAYADSLRAMAADKPEAFEAACEALKNAPRLQIASDLVIDGATLVATNAMDAGAKFIAEANKLIEGGMSALEAYRKVGADNPELARAVWCESTSNAAGILGDASR